MVLMSSNHCEDVSEAGICKTYSEETWMVVVSKSIYTGKTNKICR